MNPIKLSKGYSSWGAQMGRQNMPVSGKCHLQRMRMYDGAYDCEGAYWGCGEPLYVCQDAEMNQFFIRAKHRSDAKELVREHNGRDITFYN